MPRVVSLLGRGTRNVLLHGSGVDIGGGKYQCGVAY